MIFLDLGNTTKMRDQEEEYLLVKKLGMVDMGVQKYLDQDNIILLMIKEKQSRLE